MSRVQFGLFIFNNFTEFISNFSQEKADQTPTPIFAAIIFFTALGLSLSKTIFGWICSLLQNLSQIALKSFAPESEINSSFFTSLKEIEWIFSKPGELGTSKKRIGRQRDTSL